MYNSSVLKADNAGTIPMNQLRMLTMVMKDAAVRLCCQAAADAS